MVFSKKSNWCGIKLGGKMKKIFNASSLIIFYTITVLAGIILWLPFYSLSYFCGGCSLIDVFLFALSMGEIGKKGISLLALTWIPIFAVGITVGCYQSLKRKRYTQFSIFSGIDIAISLILLIFKMAIGNNIDLSIALVGLLVRILYYVWMMHSIHSKNKA